MRFCLAILLLFSGYILHAQHHFVRDVWLNDVSSSVKVNALTQDRLGYIWAATDEGVFYFNGRIFKGLPDNIRKPATAITIINDEVWIGYKNGALAYVKEDSVVPVTITNAKPSSAITSIYSDAGRVKWLCTEQQGVILLVNNTGFAINTTNGLSDNFTYSSLPVSDKRILIATDKGINDIDLENGKVNIFNATTAVGLPDNIVRVLRQIPSTTLCWVGTQQGGLAIYDWKTRKVIVPSGDKPWTWGQVNDILPIDQEKAWVATQDGYLLEVKVNDNQVTVKPNNYSGKKFFSLLMGRSGIVWAATEQGLTMITAEYMSYLSVNVPYRLTEVGAMTCDKRNVLWFAQNNKLYNIPINNFNGSPSLVLTLSKKITSLYADGEDRLWIGTLGGGLWYKASGSTSLTRVSDIIDEPRDKAEMNDENILDVTGTYDRLWVAGIKGVKELTYPGTYTKKMFLMRRHNKQSGIGSDYVYQLYPDRRGRIWMATDGGGVCMYGDGRYKRWTAKDGLNSSVIYNVTQDASGNIWAATLMKGLYRLNNDKWQPHHDKGLQDLNISTLAANKTGHVIVVHSKGVDVWYPNSSQFRNYNKRTNSNFIDSTSNILKLYANDTAGNVYIPFDKGFVVFKNINAPYDIRPVVKVSSVSVFLKPVTWGTKDFNYDQNHISFRFDGINFANPDNLHYRYKLEGYNDSWIVTNDESVTFPQLTTGEYNFRVQASLNNTFSRQGEASYKFYVDKPFWKRFWFIGLVSFFIIGVAYGYIRFREENLRKVSSLQRERMMFEYEHLKSQVNPHFLFNSLNTLTNLIEEDRDVAMSYTSRLSDLYRNMLSYRDKDLIYLYEEWDILENYMYIQQSRFGKALRLNTIIGDELMYSKKIVPMALQLLVENAIKHNIVSQSMPLVITIEATEDMLTVRNPLQPKISQEKGAGLGLINIRKRYNLLTKKQISFGIKDKEYIVILPLI